MSRFRIALFIIVLLLIVIGGGWVADAWAQYLPLAFPGDSGRPARLLLGVALMAGMALFWLVAIYLSLRYILGVKLSIRRRK